MNAHIVFKPTKLSVWYPTINGKDAYRELKKLHGCTFLKADHPVFENQDDAGLWATEHGYAYEFDAREINEPADHTEKRSMRISPKDLAALLADD